MRKAIVNQSDFKGGISGDKQKGFSTIVGLDPFREEGVIQINKKLEAQDIAGNITDAITDFSSWNSKLFASSRSKNFFVSSDDGATWSTIHTNAQSGECYDIKPYNGYLYYSSDDYLGRTFDGISWNDVFSDGSATQCQFDNGIQPHIMKEFRDLLYITDGNVVSQYDSVNNLWKPEVLKLPTEERILTMETYGSQIVIGTESGTFYLWDGESTDTDTRIDTNIGGIYAIKELDNIIFVFAGIYGVIYTFNGSDLVPYIKIPNFEIANITDYWKNSAPVHTGVRQFGNGLIFGDSQNGLFLLSRNKKGDQYSLVKYGPVTNPGSSNNTPIPYLIEPNRTPDNLIIGYNTNIDKINSTAGGTVLYGPNEAYFETPIYDITTSNGQSTMITGFQALFKMDESDTTIFGNVSNRIKIQYKLNRDSSWQDFSKDISTLDSVETIKYLKILKGIHKKAREIQFKISFGDGNGNNTKLTNFKLF